jgi:hypothetical protein
MSDTQQERRNSLISSGSRGLVTRSSSLVRRGLKDLSARQTRTLRFPSERSIGLLFGVNESFKVNESFGEAQGNITVPAETMLCLAMYPNVDLSPLAVLEPNALQMLFPPSDCTVSDSELAYIKGLTGLKALYLCGMSKISDAGLSALQNLQNLQVLDLRGSQLSDEGVLCLAKLTALRLVNLVDTQVSTIGVAKLRGALPGTCIVWGHTEEGGFTPNDEERELRKLCALPLTWQDCETLRKEFGISVEVSDSYDVWPIEDSWVDKISEYCLVRSSYLCARGLGFISGKHLTLSDELIELAQSCTKKLLEQVVILYRWWQEAGVLPLPLGCHILVDTQEVELARMLREQYKRIRREEARLQCSAFDILARAYTFEREEQSATALVAEWGETRIQQILKSSRTLTDASKKIRDLKGISGPSVTEFRQFLETIRSEKPRRTNRNRKSKN